MKIPQTSQVHKLIFSMSLCLGWMVHSDLDMAGTNEVVSSLQASTNSLHWSIGRMVVEYVIIHWSQFEPIHVDVVQPFAKVNM